MGIKPKISMKPLVSYYGGKQKLASKLISLIPRHTVYVEPFCGGATLLFRKPWPKVTNKDHYREIINDIDERLIIFYRQVIENGDELKKKIDATLYSQSDHKKSAYILRNFENYTNIEIAWAYYISISQSFSNKLLSGWGRGVYGRNLAVTWDNNKDILNYIDRLSSVTISCQDALTIIKQWDSPQTFFYCDPPYPGTKQGHYKGYSLDDFKKLIKVLDCCQGSFLLSCYECCSVPNDWEKFNFTSYCSSSGKGKVNADRSRKVSKKELGNRKRIEIVYRRFNKVPVRKEIQKLYDSGKFDCFVTNNKWDKKMRLLIDISALAYASYYKLNLKDDDGVSTSVIFGVLRKIKSLISEIGPSEVVLIYDGSKGSQKRRYFYSEYKAARDLDPRKVEAKKEVSRQLGIVSKIFSKLPVIQLKNQYMEADDIFWCLKDFLQHEEVGFVTGDQDIYPLVTYPRHCVIDPSTGQQVHMEMEPHQYLMYKVLKGDPSDSIEGLRSVGDNTAKELIAEHGNLDNLLIHIQKKGYLQGFRKQIPYIEARDIIRRNRKLIELGNFTKNSDRGRILDIYKYARLKLKLDEDRFTDILFDMGFTSILGDIDTWVLTFKTLLKDKYPDMYKEKIEYAKIIKNPYDFFAKIIRNPKPHSKSYDREVEVDEELPASIRAEIKASRGEAIRIATNLDSADGLEWLSRQSEKVQKFVRSIIKKLNNKKYYPTEKELKNIIKVSNKFADEMPDWSW